MGASLTPKSKKGQDKAYLWMVLDHDGVLKATCYEARGLKELLSTGHWAKACAHARTAVIRSTGATPAISSSGLVDPATGLPL